MDTVNNAAVSRRVQVSYQINVFVGLGEIVEGGSTGLCEILWVSKNKMVEQSLDYCLNNFDN